MFSYSQENVYLIKEINDLRRELKLSRTQVHDLETSMNTIRKQQQLNGGGGASSASIVESRAGGSANSIGRKNETADTNKMIDLQKQEMRRLRAHIVDLESKISERPHSGNRLPPLQQVQ